MRHGRRSAVSEDARSATPYWRLNALLAKEEHAKKGLDAFLSSKDQVSQITLDPRHQIDGMLFVKNPEVRKPRWAELVDEIAGRRVDELTSVSSSAVLLARVEGNVFAFPLGYGRFLLKGGWFRQDFGLKTALNTLDHQSLRSVDTHTLDGQPIQRRSQSVRASEASTFGIDVFKDVLKAVTGSPRTGVRFESISGGGATFAFGAKLRIKDLPALSKQLLAYFEMDLYKTSFGWVDNIRVVSERDKVSKLDASLLAAVKQHDQAIAVTTPVIVDWDEVAAFRFTRNSKASPTLDAEAYLKQVNAETVSIESIRRDKLHVTDVHEQIASYSVYNCLYYEIESGRTKAILFSGVWYEVDLDFMKRIDDALDQIQLSTIDFPGVQTWVDSDKESIESEEQYNSRVASHLGFYLLDRQTIKSTKTTSPIELCDLLTADKQLIHVKHRKGGSSGLSHLFAQASVAAEVMLGDRAFRKSARKVIRRVNQDAVHLVPLDGFKSSDFEVVFLILGEPGASVKSTLPFFSKVNLTRVHENLTQRGFKVRIHGAERVPRAVD